MGECARDTKPHSPRVAQSRTPYSFFDSSSAHHSRWHQGPCHTWRFSLGPTSTKPASDSRWRYAAAWYTIDEATTYTRWIQGNCNSTYGTGWERFPCDPGALCSTFYTHTTSSTFYTSAKSTAFYSHCVICSTFHTSSSCTTFHTSTSGPTWHTGCKVSTDHSSPSNCCARHTNGTAPHTEWTTSTHTWRGPSSSWDASSSAWHTSVASAAAC